jgi:glucose/arabinose dehydrogenase
VHHETSRARVPVLLAALSAAAAMGPPVHATTVPAGFVHEQLLGEPFVGSPVAFDFLPDGRFVLVELETGVVRVAAAGAASSDSIAVIPDVRADHRTRGLLGVAVDPNWPARPYLYFHYTALGSSVHIAMWEVEGALANPASSALRLTNPFLLLTNIDDNDGIHNAGAIRFAPDGTLLVSIGDDAQPCRAQDLASPLGKILRLDVSAMPGSGAGPPDLADLAAAGNPFPGSEWTPLIGAWGLRNPFRFDVDPTTGDAFIGNVGATLFEEIERVPFATPGLNFGWPQYEHTTAFACCGSCGQLNSFTFPIHALPHPSGVISVIGGPLLRAVPASSHSVPIEYDGDYLFAEFFTGRVSRLRGSGDVWDFAPPVAGQPDSTAWATGFVGVSDIRQGPDGAIYLASLGLAGDDFARGIHRVRAVVTPANEPQLVARADRMLADPNPSRSQDTVRFRVPLHLDEVLDVRIFDAAGRLVRRLEEPSWDGRDDAGETVPAGVYFARARGAGGRAGTTVTRIR